MSLIKISTIPLLSGWALELAKILILSIVLILSSCTKVVDISLNDAEKKYVIEGVITDEQGYCRVKITQTVNFSDANNFPPVSGAVVTVKDDNGTPVILHETSAGIYQNSSINGTWGHTYALSVTINNQVFTAISQMPQPVNFDSLYVEELSGFGSPTKFANVVFKDPPGKGNAYHFIQYKNGRQNKTIFILNDDFSDGRVNNILLVNFQNNDDDNKEEIKSGDSLKIEMQCVDKGVYKYWYSLGESSTGSNNNATPGNPVTNITGNALGYFSAHTVQTKNIITP